MVSFYWKNFCEAIKRTSKMQGLISFLLAMAISFLRFLFGLQFEEAALEFLGYLPLICFLLIIFNTFKLIHEKLVELEKKLEPGFGIILEQGEPFVQPNSFQLRGQIDNRPFIFSGKEKLFRIKVKNNSQVKTIQNVEVKLNELEPKVPRAVPMHLHLKHNNDEPFIEKFDLNPGKGGQEIDVVAVRLDLEVKSAFNSKELLKNELNNYKITLIPSKYLERKFIPWKDQYKLVIEITGKDTPSLRKEFLLKLHDPSNPIFEMLI